MAITLPNLGLVVWNSPDDPYNSAQFSQNLQRIDEHDHSPGKGRPLSPDALADGAVGTLKLADQGVTTGKIADLNVTTGKIADGGVTYTKLDPALRDFGSNALQEGVVNPGDGLVTYLDAVTVRVAAGTGWIDGDGVNGLNGRYRVTWPQTDITLTSASSGQRGYFITVPVPTAGHGVSAPIAQPGSTDQPVVDHDLLQGVGALASGALSLASVIAGTTGVSATNDNTQGIRGRRPIARGARYRWREGGEQDITFGTSYTELVPNASPRFESNGQNLVQTQMRGVFNQGAAQILFRLLRNVNGTSVTLFAMNYVLGATLPPISFLIDDIPPAGTVRYSWQARISSGTGHLLTSDAAFQPYVVTLVEHSGGMDANGSTI